MRLLLVTNDYMPKAGGIQTLLANLIEGWDDRVRVVGPSGAAAYTDEEIEFYAEPFMWPTFRVRRFVEEQVADFQPDVVLFGAPHPLAVLGPGLRTRTGTPYVVMTHGGDVTVPAAIPGLRQALTWSLRSADIVFAVSRFTASRVSRLVDRHVEVLGAGVDTEAFHPRDSWTGGEGSPEELSSTRGDQADLVLGSVGRFIPRKGHGRVLQAAAELRARGNRVEVLIVGWGRLEARLRNLATRLGVPTRFETNVAWDRIPSLYRSMDAFAMPTRSRWFGLDVEGLGISCLEAAASGLPVVAGSSGGSPETVDSGTTGYVADSVSGIVEAVEMWLAEPAEARAMGRSGRDRIEDSFTWGGVVEKFRRGVAAAIERTSPDGMRR